MVPCMVYQEGNSTFVDSVMENLCSFLCWVFILHRIGQSMRDKQEPSQGSYLALSNGQTFSYFLEVAPEIVTNHINLHIIQLKRGHITMMKSKTINSM